MAPTEGGSGRPPRKRATGRPSSIRSAAETAAGSASPGSTVGKRKKAATPLSKKAAAGRTRGSAATRQAAAEALEPTLAAPSAPARSSRRRSRRAGQAPPRKLAIDADEFGVIDVTGGLDQGPLEPEIPDLPPPEGSTPESGGPGFPDYEVRSDSWDPWDDAGAGPGRTDPDFDAQRTLGEWLEGVIPADAQVHFIKAGSEFAKGVQVTVDHHSGKRRGTDADPAGGPSRIEIE